MTNLVFDIAGGIVLGLSVMFTFCWAWFSVAAWWQRSEYGWRFSVRTWLHNWRIARRARLHGWRRGA